MTACDVVHLGTLPYRDAFSLQTREVERLIRDEGDDVLYFVEHPHVITVGRNADGNALVADQRFIASRGADVVETNRGGDVTYHGPGQLVGYPLLRLQGKRRDIRRYVHDLEEVMIRTLADYGITGIRHPEHRGVWCGGRKIASVGIRISRWVTCHGFALNVNTDLSFFDLMDPCGITGCEMTSMQRILGEHHQLDDVAAQLCSHFAQRFEREMTATSKPGERRYHVGS